MDRLPMKAERLRELTLFVIKKEGTAKELARAQAILIYEKDINFPFFEEIIGLRKSTMFKWRARFLKDGIDGLRKKKEEKSGSFN